MTSEDRWTYPAEQDTSRDIDREHADAETVERKQRERAVTHPQQQDRLQGLTSDAPGTNPADRHTPYHQPEEDEPTFER